MTDNQCKSCGIRHGYHINTCPALQAVAYLVEGFDHNGKLYGKVLHFTPDEARDSAAEFARHYSTVTTTPLVRYSGASPSQPLPASGGDVPMTGAAGVATDGGKHG